MCSAIGYGDNLSDAYVDEKDVSTHAGDLFTSGERDQFSTVAITDFKSFKNNEEMNSDNIDTRGSSSGYAIWPKSKAGDYANIVETNVCLTGYGPAISQLISVILQATAVPVITKLIIIILRTLTPILVN